MPELPEVEHVSRSLDRIISGSRILSSELRRPRLVPDLDPDVFLRSFDNVRINFVHRRGKHVLFDLDNQITLITHLRMSGRFMVLPSGRDEPKFTHAVFHLDGNRKLLFQDQRHFGMMKVVPTDGLSDAKELAKLAPEPFSDAFSAAHFRRTLGASKRSLKEFLIDQTKVCGLGNIYASEAMFLARTNPAVRADSLSAKKSNVLHSMIRQVLAEAIDFSESSTIDPEDLEGGYFSGGTSSNWRVYGREGEPCAVCSRPVARIRQGQRSTYFCRKCQRK